MVRINLLSEGRRPVVARKTKPKLGVGDIDPSALILLAGLLIGLVVAGVWWFRLHSELEDVKGRVQRAERKVEELRPIIAEVQEFKDKQAELQRKIDIIQDLRRRQEGPVHIMDKVSRALPDLVWLEEMTFRGKTVDLRGRAFNTNAVAAFIENLDREEEFQEPDTKDIQADRGGNSYTFRISFSFIQPPANAEGGADQNA